MHSVVAVLRGQIRVVAVALCAGAVSVSAWAQVLSSPLGTPAAPAAPASVPAAALPHGQGSGIHSPLSPFAPLAPRSDVVPWFVLTAVSTKVENRRIVPVYPPPVLALHQARQRIQGFMMPLEPGERQRHFLLSSVPLTCAFCTPGGPESMVEVRASTPVKYSQGAVVVEGQFHVLQNDPAGLYYRMTGAVGVK
ncbi:MAG: hypothetical protein RLZZ352_150 [Pseudomonadota bacterium]|jgi:hypothetical protein